MCVFFLCVFFFSNSQLSSSTNVAYIFKGAREYKQCKSSNRPDMIWTLFSCVTSTNVQVRSLRFCCFMKAATPFIHILFYY